MPASVQTALHFALCAESVVHFGGDLAEVDAA